MLFFDSRLFKKKEQSVSELVKRIQKSPEKNRKAIQNLKSIILKKLKDWNSVDPIFRDSNILRNLQECFKELNKILLIRSCNSEFQELRNFILENRCVIKHHARIIKNKESK